MAPSVCCAADAGYMDQSLNNELPNLAGPWVTIVNKVISHREVLSRWTLRGLVSEPA